MNKLGNLAFALVLMLGIALASAPQSAEAGFVAGDPSVAEGEWNTGAEVDVDLTAAPAPSWLQLLAKGVKIEAPARICHPFRGGQFGWTADIRQLVNGKWVKLATTADWVPSREGKFMACAQAPAAGTYAIFGYYKKLVTTGLPVCGSDISFITGYEFEEGVNNYSIFVVVDPYVVGETIRYDLLGGLPAGVTGGAISGSGVVEEVLFDVGDSKPVWETFGVAYFSPIFHYGGIHVTGWIRYTTSSCYKDVYYDMGWLTA